MNEERRLYWEQMEREDANRESNLERMMDILREHGIKMSGSSCGCYNGLTIRFEYNGETVVAQSEANFDMFKEQVNEKY